MWQVYEGYDLWGEDKRQPDFANCSTTYHGPKAGRACHPKSIIRPLAIKDMNVHFLAGAHLFPFPLQYCKPQFTYRQCLAGKQPKVLFDLCYFKALVVV